MTEPTQNPPGQTPCHVTRWRIATIACLMLLAIAGATGMSMFEQFRAQIVHMQTKLRGQPQIRYIALLQDDKHLPAQLITFDPQDGFVQIQRLNDVREGPDDSMQLWAINGSGQAQSLGVVSAGIKTAQLPATDKQLRQATRLAISVENRGGVEPGSPPRLPYLFTGALIQKAL